MVRPHDRAVDHVGADIPLDHFGQRLQHGVEHAGRRPAPGAAEHAVPLAVLVRQTPPLLPCPGDPDHALEVAAVILCGAATRLERLARSTRDLLDIAEKLTELGAGLRSLAEPWGRRGADFTLNNANGLAGVRTACPSLGPLGLTGDAADDEITEASASR